MKFREKSSARKRKNKGIKRKVVLRRRRKKKKNDGKSRKKQQTVEEIMESSMKVSNSKNIEKLKSVEDRIKRVIYKIEGVTRLVREDLLSPVTLMINKMQVALISLYPYNKTQNYFPPMGI